MSRRISHSLLDPWLSLPIRKQYSLFHIPCWFPPEGIVLIGHLFAILGAWGLAYSTQSYWGGLLAALGIAGNHIADLFDGTHARTTGQCRHGGELLDHFTDPLSFAYWMVGIAISCGRLDLGLVAVIGLYATALLTSIKAKLTGEFTLAACGPTEFKTLLVCYSLLLSLITSGWISIGGLSSIDLAVAFYLLLIGFGLAQLAGQLYLSVRQVNRLSRAVDETEWVTTNAQHLKPTRDKPAARKRRLVLFQKKTLWKHSSLSGIR